MTYPLSLFPLRRALLATTTALGLLAGAGYTPVTAPSAHAAPPEAVKTQVPGYYRQALGDFTVTALYDGYIDLAPKLLHGLRDTEIQSLLARMFIAHEKGVQTAVNAYLIHTGEHLVLVDTGAASCFGPTLGQVKANLNAAGYRLEDVDTVLLTHLHGDHLCGVLDAQGQPAFPNATVWAAQKDADFWLSPAVADAAPEGMKGFFKMSRDAAAPYQAAGRFKTFQSGEALLPGLSVVPTNGHTPGHTSFLFESKGQKLLVWGDIVHSHSVQFARPEVSFEYDTDQKQAIATRKALFQKAAAAGWWIGGAHLPFPGLGHIRKDPKGYAWVPVEFGRSARTAELAVDADVNAPAAPAVWAPPPRLFVAAWGIGAGLSALWPMPPGGGEGFGGTPAGRGALALALIAAGLALVAWAFQTLRRHDTSPDPRRAASALVTQGPFAWSRNPVYVAMTWIYLGATLAWNAAGPLWTLPVLLAVMDRLVVQREEAHLRARFGSAYEDYARRVRRWI